MYYEREVIKTTAVCFILLVFGLSDVRAQTDPIIKGSDIKPFTASGGFGITASTYGASGIDNRRAPASVRTNANMNFSMFGFRSGINLLYSTDQTGIRQNMNAISFDATYRWLTVQAGTVSPNFSEYGLNGTTIRGGYIKLDPGKWKFEFTGGRSQRAVRMQNEAGFRDPAFERYSFGGKMGIGNENSTHFYLSSHYSKDNPRSIDSAGTVTPQQNLTLTPDAKISLFENKLSLSGLATVSAFTRDLNSDEIPTDGAIPGFVTKIFKPYTSSRINYAGKLSADYSIQNFGFNVGFERIQPGFISLGVSRIRDDLQTITVGSNAQFLEGRLGVQATLSQGRDNLLGTRLQTASNTAFGTNVTYRFTDMISLTSSYNLMQNGFSSSQSSDSLNLGQKQMSHTLMMQPNFIIQSDEGFTHNVSVSGSYFNTSNTFRGVNTGQDDFSSDTYSSTLAYSIRFPAGFAVNAMGNFLVFNSSRSTNTTTGANLGASYAFFENKLNLSVNAGLNQNKNEVDRSQQNLPVYEFKSRQLMFNMSAGYQLYKKGSLSLSVRNSNNSVLQGAGVNYSEIEGSLVYRHRF